jgi:hypothetical protein
MDKYLIMKLTVGTRMDDKTLEGQMSLSKKFPQQSRLFCSKRYNFIITQIDFNVINEYELSQLIWK